MNYVIVLLIVLISACSKEETENQTAVVGAAEIIAVNYPLYYFTTELAVDLATITLLVPGGVDPAEWTPNVDEILRLQQADLVILNGAGYSRWLNHVSLTESKLIDTTATVSSELIPLDQQTTHSHGPQAVHSHGGYASTTWMDLALAQSQVQSIARALAETWPGHADVINQRKTLLLNKLNELDKSYKRQVEQLTGRTVFYSHPVYQYFERRYQLPGFSLHWEPDEQPSEKQWGELERQVANKSDVLLIWEDSPLETTLQRLNRMKIQTVVITPAAAKSGNTWYEEQLRNIDKLNACCS